MKAIAVMTGGAPVAPNMQLIDVPEPLAGPGELRIRTEASGLNHLDLWVGQGLPGIDRPWPRVTGCDGVGRVDSVGEGVDDAWLGRRVIMNAAVAGAEGSHPDREPAGEAFRLVGEHTPGSMAEAFVAPAANVLDLGEEADPIEGAAFGLTHLTAWRMIVTRARAAAGDWVLIPGIGGGVALAALGICRHLGCRTVVTSRHQWKLDRARDLGADAMILDEGEDWSRAVRGVTGRRGVDICIDSIGKAVHGACIRSMARGGRFVTCGATSGGDATTDLTRVFWNQLAIMGSTMGDMGEFRQVVELFRRGALRPVLDGVMPFSDALKAWERLETGSQFGNLVIGWSALGGNID
ncbi:MAG: hypothetical protein CMJ23_02130 [Phycisphaerae bacterium]|nr:hypothetical protein [Phycisphaerae bacterium]